jgi:hypothetical protein
MSADTADDYEYAEGLLTTYEVRVAAIRDAFTALIGAAHPGEGSAFRALDVAIIEASHVLDDYCRPTCGQREYGTCTEETCACLCHANEMWFDPSPWEEEP